MRRFFVSLCLGTALFAGAGMASAQQTTISVVQPLKQVLSYQGVLARDGIPVADGEYLVSLSLYCDPNGGKSVWQGSYYVHTHNGVFDVLLGSGDYPLPESQKL